MRKLFFSLPTLVLGLTGTFLLKSVVEPEKPEKGPPIVVGCAPGVENSFPPGPDGKFITLLPGRGNHQYAISTTNDSAQHYFDQGLSLYYSYHMKEAIASFKEAARFDSTCAMAYWGQALAMGPTYNGGYLYKMEATVPPVLVLMNRFAAGAKPVEQDLIKAMNSRYQPGDKSDRQRDSLNRSYAAAMKPLVQKYPSDITLKALYVDAVMLTHPWEFWYNDGKPKPWTVELVRYCEDILQKDPHHPAGLHYYIHVTEASRHPEIALASADSLLKLFPGVAHMVHMSSHEYERIGYYAEGVKANIAADKSLGEYNALASHLSLMVHVPHYFAVEAYCAISGAMYKEGLPKAITCRNSAAPAPDKTYQQYLYMFPLFAMVRMGRWQDILADKTMINKNWTYALLLNDFAKGMAQAKTGHPADAQKHLSQLQKRMRDTALQTRFTPFMSSAFECAQVAENILAATIAFHTKDYGKALSAIQKAVQAEDSLLYTEPKIWMLPARQYWGAFLLELNKPKEAEAVYREDLVWNPGNGWSLLGLHKALEAQGKTAELTSLEKQYRHSFSGADRLPPGSAY